MGGMNTEFESIVRTGKETITEESRALSLLAETLDGSFAGAVRLMLGCRGRIILTGMGKSGHIARKIAATLSSTGTPALFVHPAEAGHGDLGSVTKEDVVLALSNSGQTPELAAIINFATRHAIPLIAMTRDRDSLLGSQADIRLILPDIGEACPIGCAPTSSTTMQLALGDALAMALIRERGFSAEDFRDFHPGGSLGSRLARAADIMHTGEELPLAAPGTPMAEALLVMTAKGFGCLLVTDDASRLIGIVSDGDLRRHMSDPLLERTAGDVMTREPASVTPRILVSKAIGIMNGLAITGLPVVDEEKRVVGLIHMHDCLRSGV